jgi:hypothetical protein
MTVEEKVSLGGRMPRQQPLNSMVMYRRPQLQATASAMAVQFGIFDTSPKRERGTWGCPSLALRASLSPFPKNP